MSNHYEEDLANAYLAGIDYVSKGHGRFESVFVAGDPNEKEHEKFFQNLSNKVAYQFMKLGSKKFSEIYAKDTQNNEER